MTGGKVPILLCGFQSQILAPTFVLQLLPRHPTFTVVPENMQTSMLHRVGNDQ
jgi:hypothetical protein